MQLLGFSKSRFFFFFHFDKFFTFSSERAAAAYAAEQRASPNCFCEHMAVWVVFFFPSSQKLSGSRRESEYCRVFNPLYLWGLCSIWYQICISQMGFDCFPVTHTSTHVQKHACTHTHLHQHLLIKTGFCSIDVHSSKKQVDKKGVFSLLLPPAESHPHKSKQILF